MIPDRGKMFDPGLLGEIRGRFACVEADPYTGLRIYFENAGGGMTLRSVVEVVAEQTALPDNAGRDNPTSQAITGLIRQGKADLQTFLGVTGGVVAMGESTTSLAFRIIAALVRSVPGANVVTTNLDHPAIYDSTRWLAEQNGKAWRVASLNPKTGIVDPEEILRLIDADTILLAVTHSSNNLGMHNDVERIIREARRVKPGLFVLVDGAQHVAHFPVDVERLGCDAYVFSTYKAFSKIGASFAWLSDRMARLPHERLRGSADTQWELGTRDQCGYAAWSKVTEYLGWLGSRFTSQTGKRELIVAAMTAIEAHERALSHRLLHGTDRQPGLLKLKSVSIYGETGNLSLREPVLALNVHGRKSSEVVTELARRGIRVTNRLSDYYSKHTLDALGIEECVRVSLAHYNSAEEVDRFLEAMREIAA